MLALEGRGRTQKTTCLLLMCSEIFLSAFVFTLACTF